jgi:hypothetical protein
MNPTTCSFHGGDIPGVNNGVGTCNPVTCPWNLLHEGRQQLEDGESLSPAAMLLLWHIEIETCLFGPFHDEEPVPPRTPDQDWWTNFDLEAWVPQVEWTRQTNDGIYGPVRVPEVDRYTVRMALHELALARIVTYDAAPGQPDKGRVTLAAPEEWAAWTKQRER